GFGRRARGPAGGAAAAGRRRGAAARRGVPALELAPAVGAAPLEDDRSVVLLVAGEPPAELGADQRVVRLGLGRLLAAGGAPLSVGHGSHITRRHMAAPGSQPRGVAGVVVGLATSDSRGRAPKATRCPLSSAT